MNNGSWGGKRTVVAIVAALALLAAVGAIVYQLLPEPGPEVDPNVPEMPLTERPGGPRAAPGAAEPVPATP